MTTFGGDNPVLTLMEGVDHDGSTNVDHLVPNSGQFYVRAEVQLAGPGTLFVEKDGEVFAVGRMKMLSVPVVPLIAHGAGTADPGSTVRFSLRTEGAPVVGRPLLRVWEFEPIPPRWGVV